MTRAVCHFDDPWPRPRTSRTIALAARAAVGPAASTSAMAASTAASSAASPSTTSWTSPIRWARTASNRRPPGNSARAWRLADLRDDERRDDRRQDPEARLGEPEPRPALGDDQVADRAQPHPAAERRAVDAHDERHGARVDRLEHVGHRHRVLLVAFDVERHRRAHPGDVGAGTERRPVAGQHDHPQRGRVLAGERRERRAQLGDGRGIEGVVHVGAGKRHPRHDVAGTAALEPDGGTHARHRSGRAPVDPGAARHRPAARGASLLPR